MFTTAFTAFRGALGMGAVLLKPRDPESKGLVERANGYLETSFLAGRSFDSPADFDAQLQDWLPRANSRRHRTLGCRPADRIAEDRAAMLALPPLLPDPAFRTSTRLGRDHWVRVLGSDYSVDPRAIGRRVEVRADLDSVTVTCAGQVVARHARSWLAHRTITDPAHEATGRSLREALHTYRSRAPEPEVESRDLEVYDRAFEVVR